MRIYTKTGDKGTTSLLGGQRVEKHHRRLETFGTIDELNSFLGYLRDKVGHEPIEDELVWIQSRLFDLGSTLAADQGFDHTILPKIEEQHVHQLEKWIDLKQSTLPPLKNFILPGGHEIVSLCHICRTVCRRAERSITNLAVDITIGAKDIPFLNRLADYFFVIARKMALDLKADEIIWTSGKNAKTVIK